MSEIFISHATADKPLVQAIVALLRNGLGVPKSSIFCTSLKGHGIPPGKDFNKYMQNKIQAPKMVIMVMTPSYQESQFCLMETGAVWSKSLNSFPIIVPPVSYSAITKTLGLIQGWTITDTEGLVDFKKVILDVFKQKSVKSKLEIKDEHDWMSARSEWLDELDDLLENLKPSKSIPSGTHNEALDRIRTQKQVIKALKKDIENKDSLIETLENAKDKEAVKAAKTTHNEDNAEETFEQLLKTVKDAKPKGVYASVFLHLLMDHFGKAPTFDWWNNKQELQEALDYNVIFNDEDRTAVNWNEKAMQKLRTAIQNLTDFLESFEGSNYTKSLDDDLPIDPSNKGFWEYHLDL